MARFFASSDAVPSVLRRIKPAVVPPEKHNLIHPS
jgi:hypothetical protein